MRQPDDTVGTVMSDVPVAVERDKTPVSATVCEMKGRSIAGGSSVTGNLIRMT